MRTPFHYLLSLIAALYALAVAGCGGGRTPGGSGVHVVAVEAVYGDVVRQIAGDAVVVTTLLNSPGADPHDYEPTTRDANAVARADVVIENGLGYDAFVDKLLAASPRSGRTLIVVGSLAGRHPGDNPHVWYDADALRALCRATLADMQRRMPTHRGAFERAETRLRTQIDRFARRTLELGRRYRGTPVAITEPVFDDVLHSASLSIVTPPSFSKAIENGNDPSPQDVATMHALLAGRRVAALVYNRQTVEPSTSRLLALARTSRIPVLAVTETLPPGLHVQEWLNDEISALARALRAYRPT